MSDDEREVVGLVLDKIENFQTGRTVMAKPPPHIHLNALDGALADIKEMLRPLCPDWESQI